MRRIGRLTKVKNQEFLSFVLIFNVVYTNRVEAEEKLADVSWETGELADVIDSIGQRGGIRQPVLARFFAREK